VDPPLREPPYILPKDRVAVYGWNAALDGGDPRRIKLHVLPEPFLGFHDAPVRVITPPHADFGVAAIRLAA
jgi:hypothetical protein